MVTVQAFLTAYDPSDLPGGSVDPLGFDRAYTLLAEKFLPGLTNVASRPRYLSTFCAAIALSDDRAADRVAESPRARSQRRMEAVLRLERFWALACVMASQKDEALDPGGVRGVSYATSALGRLQERGETSTAADYRLLSRQLTYGLVGIYGTVADNLQLVDRKELRLTADRGRKLADAFIEETDIPGSLRTAVVEGGTVGMSQLEKWGARAHVNAAAGAREGAVLAEALNANGRRLRSAALLQQVPRRDGELELQRLSRLHELLTTGEEDADIRDTVRVILAFERCFTLVLLAFSRALWWLQSEEPYAFELSRANGDSTFRSIAEKLPAAWQQLDKALAEGKHLGEGLERMSDVRAFLGRAAASKTPAGVLEQVLLRHRDVQRAKLDGGRPKMPWAEVTDGRVKPTLTAPQRIGRDPRETAQMLPHPYRTESADRLVTGGGAS